MDNCGNMFAEKQKPKNEITQRMKLLKLIQNFTAT